MRVHLSSARRGRPHATAIGAMALAVTVTATACQVATAGSGRPATPRLHLHPSPSTSTSTSTSQALQAPGQRSGAHPRIMIVGDSVTQGSSGDYTWQYRLYEHLRSDGVSPRMVGPYGWLYGNVGNSHKAYSYADPGFEHANDAIWGMALFKEKNVIGRKVATYRPDYLLVLLGLNDLFWVGLSQSVMAENLASFIAAARAARPHIRIVFGLIPPSIHERNPAFAASIASYNRTIIRVASHLSTNASPIAVAHDRAGIKVATDLWDGTHPNANGEVKIAAGFADVLARRFHLGEVYPRPFPVLPTGPLTPPRLTVRPSRHAHQAVLSWTLSPGAGGYLVYLKDVSRKDTKFVRLPIPLTPAQNPWTAGLLNSGDTYVFKLQACKGVDCGAFSNPASVTVR